MRSLIRINEKKADPLATNLNLEGSKLSASIDPEEIEIVGLIDNSKGRFGTLFRGRCRGQDVALKIPKKQNLSQNELESFKKEVEIMSTWFCPNINLFMGAVTKPFRKATDNLESIEGNIMIVSALMKGDAESLLKSKEVLSLGVRMKMVQDVAKGLAWLHGSNSLVLLHRDLKLSNILYDEVNGAYSCKLTDFGLSQVKPKNETIVDNNGKVVGTIIMLPPEVLSGRPYTDKAEVYSFGLVMWQFLTREDLFPELSEGYLSEFIEAIVDKQLRPKIPSSCPDSLALLLRRCWSTNPGDRPSFTEILTYLDAIIIDCSVRDEYARIFWKQNFLSTSSVPLDTFELAFFEYVKVEPTPVQKECLKAIVGTRDIHGDLVISLDNYGKLMSYFGPLEIDTVPSIFDRIESLCRKRWFYGHLNTQDSVNRLSTSSPGTFLLRFANSPEYPNSYCITKVTRERKIIHIRVLHTDSDQYQLLDGYVYKTLDDVIGDSDHLNLTHPHPNPLDSKESEFSSPFMHIFNARVNDSFGNAYRVTDDDIIKATKLLKINH